MIVAPGMKLYLTFENSGPVAIYVNVEMTPDRYLLAPSEKLEIYSVPTPDDAPPYFVWLGNELTIFPETRGDEITQINGENAEMRS